MTMLKDSKTTVPVYFLITFFICSLILYITPTTAFSKDYSLNVTIDISPQLKSNVKPEQVVFIFAKAVQGPRAPLAAVRVQVKDLPITVTLDDSMAMAPMFKLSNFKDVTVSARVSQNGQAMKSSGDLEGVSPAIHLDKNNEPFTVTIDHIVP
jgi:cytochrome c-type biogenesis protein CcmH